MSWRAAQMEVGIAKTDIRAGSARLLFTLTTVYTLAALYYVHWTLEYWRLVLRAPGCDG